jgi:ribosomal protein S27E
VTQDCSIVSFDAPIHRLVRIECTDCHRMQCTEADNDVAHCVYCGNIWDWRALRIVRLGGNR